MCHYYYMYVPLLQMCEENEFVTHNNEYCLQLVRVRHESLYIRVLGVLEAKG